uniref:Type I restriction enzyme R protein N terminus (HSDR_N) n=1 Tax=Candidatus Kentrum sp. FW TaxID=2126338 RepID=A0A450TZB1_9GAMM|nr:MAG: hypothetical protein BECKFW1821C_GA0114237_107418 [Candidatus Kentron sp. FW]
MRRSILSSERDYTFSDFFHLAYPTEDIVKEFGIDYSLALLELPHKEIAEKPVRRFQEELTRKLPKISLNSEVARRDFLIAPILLELLNFIDGRISAEYPLEVERNLRGTLDYLIRTDKQLMVIEAKKADLDKGFTQLAVELIAVARYEEDAGPLFGVVTTGDLWKFGKLEGRRITKDMDVYRVPTDMVDLFGVLVGVLT